MTLLCDHEIRSLVQDCDRPMIEGFIDYGDRPETGVISYGLTSVGYDIRLGTSFKILRKSNTWKTVQNVKKTADEHRSLLFREEDHTTAFVIHPKSFILGVSVERFNMPKNVAALALDKSTYARTGLVTNITPLEPGWEGYLTLEIHNPTNTSIVLFPLEGIIQAVFYRVTEPERVYGVGRSYHNQPPIPVHAEVR